MSNGIKANLDKLEELIGEKVPEYIDFRPSPREMEELFGFTPQVPLAEGLPILARHLEESG